MPSPFRMDRERVCFLVCFLTVGCSGTKRDTETTVSRVYDVEPLLTSRPEFQAPRLGVVKGASEEVADPAESDTERDAARQEKLDRLIAVIKESVSRAGWLSGNTITADGDRLRVSAPAEVHDQLDAFLKRKIGESEIRIRVDMEWVMVNDSILARLSPSLAGRLRETDREGAQAELSSLSSQEVDEVRELVRGGDGERVRLPSVTAWNGQLTHSVSVHQEALIVDVKESRVDGEVVREPEVGVLNTGHVTKIRPSVTEDMEWIDLDLEWSVVDVRRPIQSAVVYDNIPIALPEISMHARRKKLRAKLNAWSLADSFAVPREKGSLPGSAASGNLRKLLLVRAEIADE